MKRYEPKGSWLFKVVPIFIAFVFIVVIGSWLAMGYVAIKATNEIDQRGLKSVLEEVWEGPKEK